jgi:hypothetical protein
MAYPMHILGAFHELTHVKFYVTWDQLDTLIFKKASKVVIHVWKNHVNRNGRALAWRDCVSCDDRNRESGLASNNNHVNNIDDARVVECLKNLDLSEGSYGHSFLLVVHENPLEGNDVSRTFLDRFMDLTGEWSGWR